MSKERALLKEVLYVIGEYTEDAQERTEILIAEIEKLLAQPEQKQEPVAWKGRRYGNLLYVNEGDSIPLYTYPPKLKRLTSEEINDGLSGKNGIENWYDDRFMDGVIFAEKHHGITGVDNDR